MYSQCPQCQAIFSVSEVDIAAHHGLVRCGHCRAIFHAVTNEVGGGAPVEEEPPGPPADSGPGPAAVVSGADAGREHVEPSLDAPAPRKAPRDLDVDHGREEPAADEETAPRAPPESMEEPLLEPAGEPDEDFREAPVRSPGREAPRPGAGDEIPIEDDEEAQTPMIEPVLHAPGEAAERTPARDDGFPGDLEAEVEEILIEAPPVLWGAFQEDIEEVDSGARGQEPEDGAPSRGGKNAAAPGRRASSPGQAQGPGASGAAATGRRPDVKSPYRARDIAMVELPQPRPFKTASLSLLSVFLVLLLVWQVKTFYLDELAQIPLLRPYLERICHPLGCVLPPRRDFAAINLVGTSINVNREIPGALEITASLVNKAHFPQPYPPLRVTLTDREGRVVGRRTYLPSEYQPDGGHDLLPIQATRDVSINLAQPAENAVGYEVELIAPVLDGAE